MNERKAKYAGCLVGLAVGDALGAPLEFWSKEKVNEHINIKGLKMSSFSRGEIVYPVGFYTDDTSQAICLAESLIEKGFDLDDQFKRYRKWFFEGYATPLDDKQYGIGQQTLRVLMEATRPIYELDHHIEKAGGNGSLMRSAPVGLYYQGNFEEIQEKSLYSSHVTHPNQVASWACVILNTVISLCIDGQDKSAILSLVKEVYKEKMPKEIEDCLSTDYFSMKTFEYPVHGYSLNTLEIALWAWLTSDTFEQSIEKAIRLGNDTDTFAAVTGAIAGSYYGINSIPDVWRNNLMKSGYLHLLAEKLDQTI
jgi:ADP-ribosyl-[dinitrogen reductase] hydrolase